MHHAKPPRRPGRALLTVVATAILLIVGLAAPSQADTAGTPGPKTRIPGRDDGRILGIGIQASNEKALAKAEEELGVSAEKPVVPSQEQLRNHALDQAFRLHQYSNAGEASKLSSKDGSSPLASTPPLTWPLPETPSESDVGDCLDGDEARGISGRTLNRWTWCQELHVAVNYFQDDTDPPRFVGTMSMVYQAYVSGSYGERGARVYWRPKPGSLEMEAQDPTFATLGPQQLLTVNVECGNAPYKCQTGGLDNPQSHTWADWNQFTDWSRWTLLSPAAGYTSDLVAFHPWHLAFSGSGDYKVPTFVGQTNTLRCDSAPYFSQFGIQYPKACVTYDVVSRLQYSLAEDSPNKSVAQHIRDAFDNIDPGPDQTYPKSSFTKEIPGEFTGKRNGRALHRVLDTSQRATDNETYKDFACNNTGVYAGVGLPTPPPSGFDCDEYPFKSTEEGAANRLVYNGRWDFSVRAVPSAENRSAGGSLGAYYFSDRILLSTMDDFWVEIKS